MTAIARHIEAFLREHLVRHRGASQHTCDSYAYSFQALFEFASQKFKVQPSALTLEQLDAPLISSFLEHLENTRGNTAETQNIRLAAFRSFFRFVQHREPVNARGGPLTRWGVAYILKKHGQMAKRRCSSFSGKQLSPHVLRHTSAMIVLQATQDIRKVSLWLGHSSLTTTEVYVRADPPHLRKGRFRARQTHRPSEDQVLILMES